MQHFNAIGLMSGSSLDGVDLCYVEFRFDEGRWKYFNILGETIAYSESWKHRLLHASKDNAEVFCKADVDYGHYLGNIVKGFISKNLLKVDFIASHGHTIFHQPNNRFTTQIGDGASIYAITGIKTISDFRNVDIALGGQGAPLVPIGDRDLFDGYSVFLNLGGIANMSVQDASGVVSAFDISPCNMPLNMLCEKYFGESYDKDGHHAMQGKLDAPLLNTLQQLNYFGLQPPKSLGREFMLREYYPIVDSALCSPEDKLFTVVTHLSVEISKAINKFASTLETKNILTTGGGVYNSFLLASIQTLCNYPIIVPSPEIIEFKEALIFAYLGLLRINGKANALSSVTAASRDNIGGAIWG